ncbi:hypothetical protein GQ53DRAFT_839991 [Thozetella sp. PMI_491]|nr:hypothetical protein GQ53DRAFT_839991 [Thozetella sp. PMI_491]
MRVLAMPKQAGHRPMTFTGCWTCKARRVRCDERPGSCRNCAKKGVACGGYDIKLQWVADPFAQLSAMAPSTQGRRSIRLDKVIGQRYRIEEIDSFISKIDNSAASGVSSTEGPFSTFPVHDGDQGQGQTLSGSLQDCPVFVESQEEESSDLWLFDGLSRQDNFSTDIASEMERRELHLVAAPAISTMPHDWSADPFTGIFDIAFIDESACEAAQTKVDEHNTVSVNEVSGTKPPTVARSAKPQGDDNAQQTENATSREATSATIESDQPPIRHISSSLFGNIEVDKLMHHYRVHIAELLQPVLHPHNPYHNLYFPSALEGAHFYTSGATGKTANVHSALYHAVSASAAFHLWNCDVAQTRYRKIGVEHKQHALHYLQATIESSRPGADYKIVIMVMLSLVTAGVISGDDDFAMHLDGTKQLRNLRKRWRIMSSQTRQLNDISTFLTLMARTINFQPVPSPVLDSGNGQPAAMEDESIGSVNLEYMYGVTPTIAAAIQEICGLAERLERYDCNKEQHLLPEDLLMSCEALGDKLLAWSLESEKPVTISASGEMSTIFNYHANAWHSAAWIYYCRRIQHYKTEDLAEEVRRVVEYMHAVEDTKVSSKSDSTNRMAPITWPMFIASCHAKGIERDACRRWWERVRRYGIANNEKQWVIVQKIWKREDEMEPNDCSITIWTDLFDSLGSRLLPI